MTPTLRPLLAAKNLLPPIGLTVLTHLALLEKKSGKFHRVILEIVSTFSPLSLQGNSLPLHVKIDEEGITFLSLQANFPCTIE